MESRLSSSNMSLLRRLDNWDIKSISMKPIKVSKITMTLRIICKWHRIIVLYKVIIQDLISNSSNINIRLKITCSQRASFSWYNPSSHNKAYNCQNWYPFKAIRMNYSDLHRCRSNSHNSHSSHSSSSRCSNSH
jgi:hypothetical protein